MKFSRFKFSFCWTFNILTHPVNIVKCFFNFLRLTFPVSKACRFSTAWLLYQTVYALSRTCSNFFELFHPSRSASAWLWEKSSSALKRQLDYITTLWPHCQYPFLTFLLCRKYMVWNQIFTIIFFLSGYSFIFFFFVPILVYSPPANCTGCFSAHGLSISTTVPSSIATWTTHCLKPVGLR